MLPGIGLLCKELKIGMKQGAKLVVYAKSLSKKVNRNILQDILNIKKQKGLGDIAAGTKSQAEAIGKTWVNGKNIRRFKLGKEGYGITDGVRTFRIQYKPKSRSWKANFQENIFKANGKAIETKNVHMTITDMKE